MAIEILIADDHQMVREGLRSMLEKQEGMRVVGAVADGRAALRAAREQEPDVVVMDVAMSELNGVEATRQLLAELPGVKVVALSMHEDDRYVREMMKAGASGYVLKDCAFEELAKAIREVVAGHTYVCTRVSGALVRALSRPGESVLDELTAREREVLQLYAEGHGTRDVADRLCLSVKTVETYRRQIAIKLGARNVADFTRVAIREGLLSLEMPPLRES